MRIGSLFSGVGGLDRGLELAGLGPVIWQVEQSAFRRAILAKHWPTADRTITDVRAANASTLAPVDLICGGFPCRDVSSAGKKAGLSGEHSGLWYEFARIIGEFAPSWVIVENVASGASRWLPTVATFLASANYRARAFSLSAADVGAPHIRRRIFVVAHSNAHSESTGAVNAQMGGVRQNAERVWNGWGSTPSALRMDDGFPNGMDRVGALGDSVVPACAEVIGRVLLEWRDERLGRDLIAGE